VTPHIDLTDEAASRIQGAATPDSLKEAMRELDRVIKEKEAAIQRQNYEEAVRLRDVEAKVRERIQRLEAGWRRRGDRLEAGWRRPDDIARPAEPAANRGMTPEELRDFLARPLNAKVGCLTEDGAPYVVPAWYEWDGEAFWLVPRARSAWARYLQRDPRVCLCIDEEAPPHRRVQVLGRAEIVEQPNVGGRWVPIAERMAARYLGPDGGPRYLVPTLDRPRWLIRVHPEKLTTWAGGGWHRRYLNP
jgi:PPOX class probable F420-dependent enzyme